MMAEAMQHGASVTAVGAAEFSRTNKGNGGVRP
jgi:hypothetical protein